MSADRRHRGALKVSDEVRELFPDYKAVVVYVEDLDNRRSTDEPSPLDEAAAVARATFPFARTADHPHINAWRKTYRTFGAKPSRYPCSVEGLLGRVLRGQLLPAINAATDAYNAISLQAVIPIGGEDRDGLRGDCVLKAASGEEPFSAIAAGEEVVSYPEPGEIVWADDLGVTCRRWNWRQCRRTQLTEGSTRAYFLLEGLPPVGWTELRTAGDRLIQELHRFSPDCSVTTDELGDSS